MNDYTLACYTCTVDTCATLNLVGSFYTSTELQKQLLHVGAC